MKLFQGSGTDLSNISVRPVHNTADFWIHELKLQPHPEGGYFREVYRSGEKPGTLPERYSGDRCFATSIYFLLKGYHFSAFHRITSDETWHFYEGCSLRLYTLGEPGGLNEIWLGKDPRNHEIFQYTIPHGTWFAAQPSLEDGYSLIGCTVAPGFEFEDFELGEFGMLSLKFPEHIDLLKKYCIR